MSCHSFMSRQPIMEDPYEDSVIIVDPDSSTTTVQDPDYIAPPPKIKVLSINKRDHIVADYNTYR